MCGIDVPWLLTCIRPHISSTFSIFFHWGQTADWLEIFSIQMEQMSTAEMTVIGDSGVTDKTSVLRSCKNRPSHFLIYPPSPLSLEISKKLYFLHFSSTTLIFWKIRPVIQELPESSQPILNVLLIAGCQNIPTKHSLLFELLMCMLQWLTKLDGGKTRYKVCEGVMFRQVVKQMLAGCFGLFFRPIYLFQNAGHGWFVRRKYLTEPCRQYWKYNSKLSFLKNCYGRCEGHFTWIE